MNKRVIIPRLSREETTFAVVEFSGCKHHELLDNLRRALKEWAKTEEGRAAVEEASGDFNVGDLSNYTPAGLGLGGVLGECLTRQGVGYLDIETYSEEPFQGWDFDTRLMDVV